MFGWLKDKRGIANAVGLVILITVGLIIGAAVIAQVGNVATDIAASVNDTTAQNFISNVISNAWNAMNLFVIALILVAIGFIMTLLYKAFGGGGGV